MVLGFVAVSLLAVALGVVCARLAIDRRRARHESKVLADRLAAATAERAASEQRRAELESLASALVAERDRLLIEGGELRDAHAELVADHGRLDEQHTRTVAAHAEVVAALDGQRTRADAADNARDAAEARAKELLALLDGAAGSPERASGAAGMAGAWPILLANLSRRWAAVVGVPPDARGVCDGPVADQLSEALAREAERLREEVGVDVQLVVAAPVGPADPVTFLLAATDLLGVLASMCERVELNLDGVLELSGDGWVGATHELDLARARAVAAGVSVSALEVDGEQVALSLDPARLGAPAAGL